MINMELIEHVPRFEKHVDLPIGGNVSLRIEYDTMHSEYRCGIIKNDLLYSGEIRKCLPEALIWLANTILAMVP